MINICTKYGFDSLIISGSYGGHRRHTTDDVRRTTPGVWHKLPTGELTKKHQKVKVKNKTTEILSKETLLAKHSNIHYFCVKIGFVKYLAVLKCSINNTISYLVYKVHGHGSLSNSHLFRFPVFPILGSDLISTLMKLTSNFVLLPIFLSLNKTSNG